MTSETRPGFKDMRPKSKVCANCGEIKAREHFYNRHQKATMTIALDSYCKPCKRKMALSWHHKTHSVKAKWDAHCKQALASWTKVAVNVLEDASKHLDKIDRMSDAARRARDVLAMRAQLPDPNMVDSKLEECMEKLEEKLK
jgi:hypothetical protein